MNVLEYVRDSIRTTTRRPLASKSAQAASISLILSSVWRRNSSKTTPCLAAACRMPIMLVIPLLALVHTTADSV
eukprot:1916963-Prymnesium_polylepis.1